MRGNKSSKTIIANSKQINGKYLTALIKFVLKKNFKTRVC